MSLHLLGVLGYPNSFLGVTKSIWGKNRIAANDYTGANMAVFLGDGGGALALVGPDGKVIEQTGTTPLTSYIIASSFVMTVYEKNKKKGLLGGVTIPEGAEKVVFLIQLAKYSDALTALDRVKDSSFKKTMTERLEALEAEKRRVFHVFLEKNDAWQAYRVGESLIKCFPRAKDLSEIRGYVSKLKTDSAVKNELDARKSLASLLARIIRLSGPKRVAALKQMLPELIKKYPDTVCAVVMKKILQRAETAVGTKTNGC